jgi:hypothetical protein
MLFLVILPWMTGLLSNLHTLYVDLQTLIEIIISTQMNLAVNVEDYVPICYKVILDHIVIYVNDSSIHR